MGHLFILTEICFENSSKLVTTLADLSSKLDGSDRKVHDLITYRSLFGTLQYAIFTHSDLTYPVQQLCLYMHDQRESHIVALKRVLRYVLGTIEYGLQLYSQSESDLIAYFDADWAGCPTTRRSTSCYCVFLGVILLLNSSKQQGTTSRSSAESIYRGIANVVFETCWLRNLLRELHHTPTKATIVYCDNISTIYLVSNLVQRQHTKHIFVREKVALGQLRVLHFMFHLRLNMHISSLRVCHLLCFLTFSPD